MPLVFAEAGMPHIVQRITGNSSVRKFLESLGFVPGSMVMVISENGGNLIVKIKESRIAVSREMAMKIIVETGGKK